MVAVYLVLLVEVHLVLRMLLHDLLLFLGSLMLLVVLLDLLQSFLAFVDDEFVELGLLIPRPLRDKIAQLSIYSDGWEIQALLSMLSWTAFVLLHLDWWQSSTFCSIFTLLIFCEFPLEV